MSLAGKGFDSKCDIAPPTILLGLLLSLGRGYLSLVGSNILLEKEMATHSSVLAWRIPGTGEPGGLPAMGSHGVGHS